MKLLTFCISIVITSASWAQEMKLENFYPVTRPYKVTDTKHLVDCINGDCNNGNGTLVLIRSLYSGNNAYAVRRVMTGSFSNNGKNFSGKIYQHLTNYKSPDYIHTPLDNLDLSTKEGLQKTLYLEGNFILEADSSYKKKYFSRNYLLHGLGVDYNLPKRNNQYQSVRGEYDSGTVRKAEIIYVEGSPIKKFSGWVKMDYELQFGMADYEDGGTYIGFFNNNIFDGPGKYTGSKGVMEGTWKEGGLLKSSITGFTPALLNNPDDKKDVFTYIVDGYNYKGNFYGKLVNGKPDGPAIISGNKSLFYGMFKGGVPQGTSFMKKELFNWTNQYSENIYYGQVKDNAFAEGIRIENEYDGLLHGYWIYAGKEWDGIWSWLKTTTGTGSFKEGKQSGCGIQTFVNTPNNVQWDYTMEGPFKDGRPKGWVMVTVPKFSANYKESGYKYFEGTYGGDLQSYSPLSFNNLTKLSGDLYHMAITDTSSCVLVPQEEKEKYIAKSKLVRQQQEAAAKLAAITPKDPCKERKIPVGYYFPVGSTVEHKDKPNEKFILQSYDCVTDKYFILVKTSSAGYSSKGIEGSDFRYHYNSSKEDLKFCSACKGLGETSYQIEEEVTKEWEQISFNLYIKKTPRTVSRWITQKCKVCSGTGMLKK
jgi:hypothetical protein